MVRNRMQNNDKLCPFCGSEPVENKEHYIPNNLCCPHGHTTPMIRNEWNTRPAEKLVLLDSIEIAKILFLLDHPNDNWDRCESSGISMSEYIKRGEAIANHFTAPAVIEWPLGKPILADHQEGMTSSEVSRINDYRVGYNEAIDACIAAHAKAQKVDVGKLVEEALEKCIEIVESEPEYSDTPPEEMMRWFRKVVKPDYIPAIIESHRITVKLTKKNIKDAIEKALEQAKRGGE